MTPAPDTSRYVYPHCDRYARSYAPSLFEPTDPSQPFLNGNQAKLVDDLAEVRGKLEPADHFKLYEMAYFARGPILEIGRLAGKSTICLAMGARDCGRQRLYSIEYDQGLVETATENLRSRALLSGVELIAGDSSTIVEKLDMSFDTVFVDGDHSYEGVKCDIAALHGRVVPGGSVMFHDYFHPANQDPSVELLDVTRAVDEMTPGVGLEFRGRFGGIALFEQFAA